MRGAGGTCYGSHSGRPLRDATTVKSIEACLAHSKGYTYMGLGCPSGGGFECWRGNDVSKSSKVLDMKECTGTPLTDIGNNKNNGGCSGFPQGTFSVKYKDLSVPLGGWHREPVFDRAEFMKAAGAPEPKPEPEPKPSSGACVYACVCICSQGGLLSLVLVKSCFSV